jgi:hypothetical protein
VKLYGRPLHLANVGLGSFCLLGLATLGSILIGLRPDQYCFGPPVHNWAWQLGRGFLLAEFVSVPVAFFALFVDQRKVFASLTLALFVPGLLLTALARGCN